MTHLQTRASNPRCIYPGEYIAAHLPPDELLTQLQHQHEDAPAPLVNVAELQDAFVIEVAAPGLKSGDFYASITGDILTISVLHKKKEIGIKKYYLHEFNYDCFKRKIVLPGNIDSDFISAVYADGILVISLPKSKEHFKQTVDKIIVY